MPTVCKIQLDASEYRKELQAVLAESRSAAQTLSGEGGNISVTADTENALKKLDDVKQKIDAIPKQKNIKISTSSSSSAPVAGRKTASPDPTVWEKAKSGIKGCWQEMTNLKNGAKQAVSSMLAGGGAIGILIAGFASLVKIGIWVYDTLRGKSREYAEILQRNASSIREVAEANETLRQKSDAQLSSLSQLSQQETLSNVNKVEAAKLIRELSGAYGDLGIVLDETTGKLTGVDAAMIKKAEKDRARRISEMKAEMKTLESENAVRADLRDSAGIKVPFSKDWRIGGENTIINETQKMEDNVKRLIELRRKISELKRQDPAKALRAANAAEVADLTQANHNQSRLFEEKKADDDFADQKDLSAKIKNRNALILRYTHENIYPLAGKIDYARMRVEGSSGDDKVEAQKQLLRLEKELQREKEKVHAWERQVDELRRQASRVVVDMTKENRDSSRSFTEKKADETFADLRDPVAKIRNRQTLIKHYNADKISPLESKITAAKKLVERSYGDAEIEARTQLLRLEKELQREKEKVHTWERQIAEIQHQQSEAKRQLTEQTAFELQYNKLLLAGEYDKAAALKLERDLKQQNLKLSEAEKQKLLERQKLIGSQKLGKSIKEQAFGLYGQALEKVGRGKEFAEAQAIREARETKGANLTAGETEKVKKLSTLSYRLSNGRVPQIGDLTTKTNSLTARGGFASAVKDNSARVNESINANTKMLVTTLSEIRKLIKGMGL